MANWQCAVHKHDSPTATTSRSHVPEKRILARERFRSQLIDRTIKGPTRWTRSVTDVNLAKFKDQFRHFRNHAYMTHQWHEDIASVATGRASRNLAPHEICLNNKYRTTRTNANNPTTHESTHERHPGTHAVKLPPVTPGIRQTCTTGNERNADAATNSTPPQQVVDNDGCQKNTTVQHMPSSAGRDVTSGRGGRSSSGVERMALGKEALALLEREQMNPAEMTKKWIAECQFEVKATDGREGYVIDGDRKPVRRVRFGGGDWLYKNNQFLFN